MISGEMVDETGWVNSGGGRTFAHIFERALAFVLVLDSQAPLYGQSREGVWSWGQLSLTEVYYDKYKG